MRGRNNRTGRAAGAMLVMYVVMAMMLMCGFLGWAAASRVYDCQRIGSRIDGIEGDIRDLQANLDLLRKKVHAELIKKRLDEEEKKQGKERRTRHGLLSRRSQTDNETGKEQQR